jgi:hypothetical protein
MGWNAGFKQQVGTFYAVSISDYVDLGKKLSVFTGGNPDKAGPLGPGR